MTNVQKTIFASCLKKSGLLPLLVVFATLPSPGLWSQTFRTLYHFGDDSSYDGSNPRSGLTLIGNTLFGTTHYGGHFDGFGSSAGIVFSINTDATEYKLIFSFPFGGGGAQSGNPEGAFVISDGILYGTGFEYISAYEDYGSIFSAPLDGVNPFLNNWFDFQPMLGDGSQPDGVIQAGDLLYGVTRRGGKGGQGTVYRYDGSIITNLYCFSGRDGATPNGGLILSTNGTLNGVTHSGGDWGNGTVYALDSFDSNFRILHHFNGTTNGEGANPKAGLILSGNTLFGTTLAGGTSGIGTVFSVATDGTGFTTLHSFTGGSEGANPSAALILSGETLYGTTLHGGSTGSGTVFSITVDGRVFSTLHSFSGSDGAFPATELLLASNTLYGTTEFGGNWRSGTVFSLSLPVAPPQLTITRSGLNVVLTWPTGRSSFLQSTTSLVSPPLWTRAFPGPVVVNGLNTVTNPIFPGQQFFRLSQ